MRMPMTDINVLVISANEKHTGIICRAYESVIEPVRTTVVQSLLEAHELLNEGFPDLMIADLILPDGTAMDLLEANCERSTIPLLILTDEEGKDRALIDAAVSGVDYVVVSETSLAEIPHHAQRLMRECSLLERVAQEEKVRSAVLRIAGAAKLKGGLENLVSIVHEQVGNLVEGTTGFYLAIYDDRNDTYELPYCVDEQDASVLISPEQLCRGLTDYVRRTSVPLLVDSAMHQELSDKGEIEIVGRVSKSWMGVPLLSAAKTIGVIVAFRYESPRPFTKLDLEAIVLMSDHVAIAVDFVLEERERRSFEAQLHHVQRLETIGTFASGIAHDFNNMLLPIMCYSEMALDELPPQGMVTSSIKEVMCAAERAKGLASQILTFVHREELGIKPLSLQKVIAGSMSLIRSSMPTSIRIHTDIDENCSPALADPTQFYQVVMNLCTNASHAMQVDGGVLKISLRMVEIQSQSEESETSLEKGWYVRLTISDTGLGMEPAIVNNVFEPFFSTKRRGEGTGLGLCVVRDIVLSLGGDIKVHSAPDEGSRFEVYLPATEVPVVKDKKNSAEAPKGKETILLVDDDSTIVTMCCALLSRLDYNVKAKVNSVEALVAFQTYPNEYDLVITDQVMPGLLGDELISAIRRTRPDMPALIITGFGYALGAGRRIKLNNCSIVKKPFRQIDLAQAVRKALGENPLIKKTIAAAASTELDKKQ